MSEDSKTIASVVSENLLKYITIKVKQFDEWDANPFLKIFVVFVALFAITLFTVIRFVVRFSFYLLIFVFTLYLWFPVLDEPLAVIIRTLGLS